MGGIKTNPNFASGAPVNPVDFKVTIASYAIGNGDNTIPVFDDFFESTRGTTWDMGMFAYNTVVAPTCGTPYQRPLPSASLM